MRIKKLILREFRCFDLFEIAFSEKYNTHVIIAENMVGKSAILAGLRLAVNTYTSGLQVEKQISKTDHRIFGNNPTDDLSLSISIEADFSILDSKTKWSDTTILKYKTKVDGERTKIEIKNGIDPRKESKLINKLAVEGKAIQPLFSYIGTEYIHVESSDTSKWDISGKSTDGYKGCFEDKSIKKFLFKWLDRMDSILAEMYRKPLLAEQYKDVPQNAISVFQKAVKSILPDIVEIQWNGDIKQPVVKLANGDVRPFDVLSDGYRYLILLAGELATRAFILNKVQGDSILGKINGMVLIDEFGIHLHPSLQNDALANLEETFPNIQFIISTHTPLLVNGLKKEQVHILQINDENRRIITHPENDVVGMGADTILTEIFGLKTTMDKEFQEWDTRFTELFYKKEIDGLGKDEEDEFNQLAQFLAPLRIDPRLKLTENDPITEIVKKKLKNRKFEKSIKIDSEAIEKQVDDILNDIFNSKNA
jgi:predicted ATP-binding protein involved in virulence